MKVVIMAGGRGTRIAQLFPNIPKPLIGRWYADSRARDSLFG